MHFHRKTAALKLIAVVLIFMIFGCGKRERLTAEKEGIIPVRAARVRLQDIKQTLDYAGDIRAREQALIYPRVSGKVIEKIKEDGSAVEKGDVIAYIDRDEVGFKFEKAPVESPITGIIGRFYVDIGENVTAQTPIALVVDMEKVEITLNLPEKYLSGILLGQQAEISVDAYPQEKFSGVISKISAVIDVPTRTLAVEITVDNPGYRLKSGMFAKAKLAIQEAKAVPVILKEAVIGKEPNTYVFVVENNKALLRPVKLGIREGSFFEVKEGLKAGDLVVIMGQQRLSDGANVTIEEEQ